MNIYYYYYWSIRWWVKLPGWDLVTCEETTCIVYVDIWPHRRIQDKVWGHNVQIQRMIYTQTTIWLPYVVMPRTTGYDVTVLLVWRQYVLLIWRHYVLMTAEYEPMVSTFLLAIFCYMSAWVIIKIPLPWYIFIFNFKRYHQNRSSDEVLLLNSSTERNAS